MAGNSSPSVSGFGVEGIRSESDKGLGVDLGSFSESEEITSDGFGEEEENGSSGLRRFLSLDETGSGIESHLVGGGVFSGLGGLFGGLEL